jgi:pimeloyl-ACP methyl ester carboxylesterase
MDGNGAGNMTQIVALSGGRAASYEAIGSGSPALMFAGGPGFTASYMNGDAELLSGVLCSYLIDPHGLGSSTPPAGPAGYSPEGHARFYEQARQALALPEVVVLGHSFAPRQAAASQRDPRHRQPRRAAQERASAQYIRRRTPNIC